MSRVLNRRQFLASGSLAAGAAVFGVDGQAYQRALCAQPAADRIPAGAVGDDVSFFFVSDTHFLAQKEAVTKIDEKSAVTCRGLVDTLNKLPGTSFPEELGGGVVASPRGVIHGGDIIDTGDKNGGPHPQMVQTEWAAFEDEFGLKGGDGRLKYPVYEVWGNHDSPPGTGFPVKRLIERNSRRPGLKQVSPNGAHYSWDWGPVHFVNLGIVVGGDPESKRSGRYNPLDSLSFLRGDLDRHVGMSGRPVIITHHIDVARYSMPCDKSAKPTNTEWDSCDVQGYYRAIQPYNVVAVLYGHTHVRKIFQWDGTQKPAEKGIPVFNVDNGSHFSGSEQAFFHFQLKGTSLTVRELATKDRWQTNYWTPQSWTQTISLGKS